MIVTTRMQRKLNLIKIIGNKWEKLTEEQREFMISICGVIKIEYNLLEKLVIKLGIKKPFGVI